MLPIKKINPMEKNIMERKKIQELQNKIMEQRNGITLAKGVVPDPRKRQFIKKGILGLMFGVGILAFSKITRGLQAIKLVDSPQIPTYGVLKLEGSNTTEATSTSTTQVDLLSVSSLSIATDVAIHWVVASRRTTGAAQHADLGLRLNTTDTSDLANFPILRNGNSDLAGSSEYQLSFNELGVSPGFK